MPPHWLLTCNINHEITRFFYYKRRHPSEEQVERFSLPPTAAAAHVVRWSKQKREYDWRKQWFNHQWILTNRLRNYNILEFTLFGNTRLWRCYRVSMRLLIGWKWFVYKNTRPGRARTGQDFTILAILQRPGLVHLRFLNNACVELHLQYGIVDEWGEG